MKTDDTRRLFAVLSATYGKRFVVERGTARIWHEFLRDLESADVEEAVRGYVLERADYPPTIADIRRRVALSRANLPTFSEALRAVLDAATLPEVPEGLPGYVYRLASSVGGWHQLRTDARPEPALKRAYDDLASDLVRECNAPAMSPRARLLTEGPRPAPQLYGGDA